MKLTKSTWNPHQSKWTREWLANDASEITADFDPTSACGSTIVVITQSDVYMKNTDDKWQKFGSTEVIA